MERYKFKKPTTTTTIASSSSSSRCHLLHHLNMKNEKAVQFSHLPCSILFVFCLVIVVLPLLFILYTAALFVALSFYLILNGCGFVHRFWFHSFFLTPANTNSLNVFFLLHAVTSSLIFNLQFFFSYSRFYPRYTCSSTSLLIN